VNYKPIFELVKWIDRPMELLDQSPVEPADIWRGAPMLQVRPQPVVVTAPTAPAAGLNEPEF
jgi:hypothetical protein